jgi:hypothetical protein
MSPNAPTRFRYCPYRTYNPHGLPTRSPTQAQQVTTQSDNLGAQASPRHTPDTSVNTTEAATIGLFRISFFLLAQDRRRDCVSIIDKRTPKSGAEPEIDKDDPSERTLDGKAAR